jgi:hypothetical protein
MTDGMALIRKCDKCGMITAIDLDVTLKHKRDMQMVGQTVMEVTRAEAMDLWKNAGACVHPCTKKCWQCSNRDGLFSQCEDGSGNHPYDPACKNFRPKE